MAYAKESGFFVDDITFSPIKGPEGNIEYLGHLVSHETENVIDPSAVVTASHMELDK